jgi:DNA-binding response OmpR family regulator
MNATILFLGSDPVIRKAICKALESEGYCVLAAGDIGSAVEWLKDCTPDLLMVRHYTNSMSGHDAAMYLRRTCLGVPVLIVGGILDDVWLENREVLKGFEVFPQPFKAAELLDKVKEVLAKSSPRNRAEGNPE